MASGHANRTQRSSFIVVVSSVSKGLVSIWLDKAKRRLAKKMMKSDLGVGKTVDRRCFIPTRQQRIETSKNNIYFEKAHEIVN